MPHGWSTTLPSPNGSNGDAREGSLSCRDAHGRFLPGNRAGRGNPFARRAAALRTAFYDEACEEDLRAIARRLLDAAKRGDWVAAKLVLFWTLGRPGEAIDPDRLVVREAALELLVRLGARVVATGMGQEHARGKRRGKAGARLPKIAPAGHAAGQDSLAGALKPVTRP